MANSHFSEAMLGSSFRSFEEWREATRELLRVHSGSSVRPTLPRELMRLLRSISHFRHPGRWELMTRLALRASSEGRALIEDVVDPDVRHAQRMDQAVRQDCHKMHAFVRFRQVSDEGGSEAYFSWFEPAHEILRRAAPFFVKRFPNMHWTIATPDGSAVWNGQTLQIIAAPSEQPGPAADPLEELWRTYYRSICNVSRINPRAMQREMPQRYWAHLPEATEISSLIRYGQERFDRRRVLLDVEKFVAAKGVQQELDRPVVSHADLKGCQRCALWRRATQPVAGEGPANAALMLVGEQPGDEEDLRGRPFVGPAGRLLDELLGVAGIERSQLFVTNAVKHFKWEPRGRMRVHKRPLAGEVAACAPWLDLEISTVRPRVIVALGLTAMNALLGIRGSIESVRHRLHNHESGAGILVTYHPSAVLRSVGDVALRLREALIDDLRHAADASARRKNNATSSDSALTQPAPLRASGYSK